MTLAALLLLLLSFTTLSSQDQLDGIDQIPVDNIQENCQHGRIYSQQQSSCMDCGPGTYADLSTQTCTPCPYNTFSTGETNVECEQCPDGKMTLHETSDNPQLCTDICKIPETTRSFYETESSALFAGDRVLSGTTLIFQCSDEKHKVEGTDTFYMFVPCTQTTVSDLPTNCISPYEPEESTNGLICYDKCLKESSGDIMRTLTTNEEGTFGIQVESCSLAECQGSRDICVTALFTKDDVTRTLLSCEMSTSFDKEICAKVGDPSGECVIDRCTANRCNDPSVVKASNGVSEFDGSAILIVFTYFLYAMF